MYQEIFKLHSNLLKAISHPKRLEIIQLLREQELCVNEILEMLGLPQANLSQHLKVLRNAGVVNTRKEGKQIYYKLAHTKFVKASDLLREVLIKRHKNTGLADDFVLKMTDLVPLVHDPVCNMRLSPKTASYAKNIRTKNIIFVQKGV